MATKITPAEIVHRVRVAVHQIEAARKQALSVYNEQNRMARKDAVGHYDDDLKKLREVDAYLSTPLVLHDPEFVDAEKVLTPELAELVAAPLAKYGKK